MKIPKVGLYNCELGVLDENNAVLTIHTPIDEPQRSYKLTPIPEGHGRLVDADELRNKLIKNINLTNGFDTSFIETATIVPAERSETE
jgi:hypothetical protein